MGAGSHCLLCGLELVQTGYGGLCPVHSKEFLAELREKDLGRKPPLATKAEEEHRKLQKWRKEHETE